jgi:hypothetical protein
MKTRLQKLLFWLTHLTDCGWCHRRMHRAWLPLRGQKLARSVRIPRISRGMRTACLARVLTPQMHP